MRLFLQSALLLQHDCLSEKNLSSSVDVVHVQNSQVPLEDLGRDAEVVVLDRVEFYLSHVPQILVALLAVRIIDQKDPGPLIYRERGQVRLSLNEVLKSLAVFADLFLVKTVVGSTLTLITSCHT